MKDIRHREKGYGPIRCNPPMPEENWPYRNHPNEGNDPQYTYKGPKFSRHIFVRRDQIFFDIDTQLSIIAASRKKPDGTEDDTFSNATTTFQQQFYRWIDRHIGIAKGTMSAFVLEKFKTTKMNSISQNEEVDIELLMPEYYDDTTFDQLVESVHSYIVNSVLHEYLIISLTSKDPVTNDKQAMAAEALHDIKKFVNAAKPGFIRKIQHPF